MENKNKKLGLKATALICSITLMSLTGCKGRELAPTEEYDIVQQNPITDNDLLNMGLVQTLDVPGEEFKLVAEFTCDSAAKRSWRITSDKFLYMKLYTQGLPSDVEVYIDNVHIDTSIKSKYAVIDGILQDTMDDRIHNSQMIGFPIGDDICYYGVNAVEGCNHDFIQGTFSGYNGFMTGDLKQRRYTEEDYKKMGVYANKFQIVIDLLVKGSKDLVPRNVSVATDFLVPVVYETIENEKGRSKTK
ncbi:MAG: hypothetical protein PHX62_03690 [Bacilli bacterium]|nr:hypothetical protein [Bacilli bacterium]